VSGLPAIGPYLAPFEGLGGIHFAVLAMGFFYGLTMCSLSCLPLVAPYVFATQSGFGGGFDATAVFVLTRVAGYTVLGAAAGFAGQVVLDHVGLEAPMLVSGALVLLIGFLVLVRRRTSCAAPRGAARPQRSSFRHMATLGLATSLMPCPPLYAVMLYGATTQSAMTAATLAFLFGVGTLASPIYYLGAAAGWVSGRIGQRTTYRYGSLLRGLCGLIIILFGLKLLSSGYGGL